MKIIFLDIDGVVTSLRTGWYNLDIYTVNFLRWVCKEAGVKIVISSTWRYNHDLEYWKAIFGDFIHPDYRTPNIRLEKSCRGDEILAWLVEHKDVEKYMIIDDDSDMLSSQLPYFVKTNTYNGLMFEQMDFIREYWGIESHPNVGAENHPLHQHAYMFATYNLER